MDDIKLSWTLPEYEFKEKKKDWFTALAVIIATASLASLTLGNFFFALLLIIGGALMWHFANEYPENVTYELNNKGLVIKTRLFPYETIKSFFVKTEPKPRLFIRSSRPFMPIISMPIELSESENIKTIMLNKSIPEEKMEEHISEHIMDTLGF